jgi:predicted O-methyltransferase YrrM
VRATKPKKVVETGVEKGLGSCVIAAALKKNAEEGSQGIAYGTDINPAAGYLVGGVYAPYSKIFYGDSIESLKTLEGPIDLFINDSDHSAEYEAREYDTIEPKLSSGALVLGDNAHVTDKLLLFAEKTRRSFLYFQERPSGHWYPGAGIGIAFKADVSHNR